MYAATSIHYCKSVYVKVQNLKDKDGKGPGPATVLNIITDGSGLAAGSFDLTLFDLPQEVIDRLVAAFTPSPTVNEVVA